MSPPRARRRLRPLLLAGAAAAVVAATATAPAYATYAGPKASNGRIAFVRGGDVYAIFADGTQRQQITTNAALDRDPAWAPDGRNMAFARQQNGQWDIWIIVPDGSRPVQVTGTNAFDEGQPTFSPDGRRLTYVRVDRTDPTRTELVSVDRAGANPFVLGPGTSPDWSSGGIAFAPLAPGPLQLTADRSASAAPLAGTGWAEGDGETAPSWSPDAKAIAYERTAAGAPPAVHILTVAAAVNRVVIGSAREPSWSPDSRRIAFERDGQVWVVNKDGSGLAAVTTDPAGSSSPAWQPEPAQPIVPVAAPQVDDPDPPPNPGPPPPVRPAPLPGPSSPAAVTPPAAITGGAASDPAARQPAQERKKVVGTKAPRLRLVAVTYPRHVALGARIRINARFNRAVTFRYLVMRWDGRRMVRVNGASARGRVITASYTPSRPGRYLVRLTYSAGRAKGVRAVRVRVT